jgi:hypothetical protein
MLMAMASLSAKLHSLRITPGRLVALLLVIEELLLMTEWFRWLTKGYAVLLAVASVSVVVLALLLWFLVALAFRLRFQFTIRTLLILTVAVALPLSWLGVEMKKATDQKEIVEATQRVGGRVAYDWELGNRRIAQPRGPGWLRTLLGGDFFGEVVAASYNGLEVTDIDLARLRELTQLQELHLDGTKLSDAALEQLAGLPQLQVLSFNGTKVSDAGLAQLARLTQLQYLSLDRTKVADTGLAHLAGLTQLQWLFLYRTKITEAGVTKLQQALPNCKIIH